MTFDPTVTLGTVLNLLVVGVGIMLAWSKLKERLIRIETKLDPIWTWWNTDSNGNGSGRSLDEKIEHAVRNATLKVVAEVIRQDRERRTP